MNRFFVLGILSAITLSIMGCGNNKIGNPEASITSPLSLVTQSASLRTYTTNFPLTENPISEGGNWINGGAGIDWGNVSTTPGQTHPLSLSGAYSDATALLTGSWASDQMGQGTVWVGSVSSYPEVEIRLHSAISAHSCTGYEVNFAIVGANGNYIQIVRWNGPYGNFTYLNSVSGSNIAVKAGDVVKATIVGNVITAYKNGVQMVQATDNTYTSGSPGMGFDGGSNGDYGFSSFTASELGGTTNNPPTVATADSANPSTVTGTTSALSVLGADDGGEANLTYAWSATSVPSGGSASFSPNGTNAAKNSTATFTKAGAYTLQATIADAQGLSVATSVNVTVNQTLTIVTVAPVSATLAPNAAQQFTASAKDQFGAAVSSQPTFTWAVSGGGTITASGLFAAGVSTGGPFTVTATGSGKSGTASVTVATAPRVALQINSGAGAVSPFVADAFFSGGNTSSTSAAITTAGVANAAPAAVYQSERYGNFSYTIGSLTAGTSYTVRLHFAEIYWTTAGSRVFNVSINGTQAITNFDIFAVAGANKAVVQTFSANANSSGQIVIQYVTVKDNAKSSGIEVVAGGGPVNQPPTVATTASASPSPTMGTTTNLSVLGADDGGETNLTYTWAATNVPTGGMVAFSVNGTNASKNTVATFNKAGSYTLQAAIKDQGGLTVVSNVTVVVSQTLTTIAVSPSSATVAVSGTLQLTATANDQFGLAMSSQPIFTWSVSGGGTISASGLFTASSTAGGPFTVTATGSGKSGTANVTVTSGRTALFSINAGGGAVSPFAADQYFSGGGTYSTSAAITTSGITNAAPAAVYQSERFGNATYTFTGLAAGAAHTVRLHFAEIYWSSVGARVFNVSVNGTQVLTNFDIFASAGGNYTAIVKEFSAAADASGKITIQFTTVVDNAKVSGIEILK